MYVHLKQTGEKLAGASRVGWDLDELMKSAQELAELHEFAGQVGLSVMVVSGGGNHMRKADLERPWREAGREIPPEVSEKADLVGRWGTLDNCDMLSGALASLGVENVVLLAPGMERRDGSAGRSQENTARNVQAAYEARKLVLAAGGTGEDNCTTDAAVVELALRQAKLEAPMHPIIARPSIALKATNVDKVYSRDPRIDSDEPLLAYDVISAAEMLQNTERFGVVDPRSLRALAGATANVSLLVYNGGNGGRFTPVEAVRNVLTGVPMGTFVRPGPMPEFATR